MSLSALAVMMSVLSVSAGKLKESFAVINIVPGLLVVAAFVVIAVVGPTLVQRIVPSQLRQQRRGGLHLCCPRSHIRRTDSTCGYRCLGGLRCGKGHGGKGSCELDDVFRLAHPLPDPEGRQLQELARSYAQVVVDEEWTLMAQGRTSPQAWDLLDEMTLHFESVEVRTKAEQVLYGEALDRINELAYG